jgi:hypothetical protein
METTEQCCRNISPITRWVDIEARPNKKINIESNYILLGSAKFSHDEIPSDTAANHTLVPPYAYDNFSETGKRSHTALLI